MEEVFDMSTPYENTLLDMISSREQKLKSVREDSHRRGSEQLLNEIAFLKKELASYQKAVEVFRLKVETKQVEIKYSL